MEETFIVNGVHVNCLNHPIIPGDSETLAFTIAKYLLYCRVMFTDCE